MSFFGNKTNTQTQIQIQTDEVTQQFIATEGQSRFVITKEYNLIRRVIVGGVEQFTPSFVESTGNSFTLASGVSLGTNVVAIFIVVTV